MLDQQSIERFLLGFIKPKETVAHKTKPGARILLEEETDENISKLKGFLNSISSADRKSICMPCDGDIHFSANLASFALPKIKFLNCILEIEPDLLLQERHYHYPNKFLTVLHMAIRSKNPELVTTILTHPVFVTERKNNVEADCSRLVRSYMWTLVWYHESREDNMVVLREMIASMLLESCKESMQEASLQQKAHLPEQIMKMCTIDGVSGEGYWQHSYGPALLNRQQSALQEICMAYINNTILQQNLAQNNDMSGLSK